MKQMKTHVLNLKKLKTQVPIRYLTIISLSKFLNFSYAMIRSLRTNRNDGKKKHLCSVCFGVNFFYKMFSAFFGVCWG
jgi:hypothetical protein